MKNNVKINKKYSLDVFNLFFKNDEYDGMVYELAWLSLTVITHRLRWDKTLKETTFSIK